MLDETRMRLDAIQFVRMLRDRWVAVPASELRAFTSGGRRIFLKGQQGIFKPAEMTDPLSITTTLASPYTSDPIEGSRVLYDFVPAEHENDGLKRCAEGELPLVYLLQVKAKPSPEYAVFAPVYVVGWDEAERRFLVDLTETKPGETVSPATTQRQLHLPVLRRPESPAETRELARSYAIHTVQQRLYQARFRNAILAAYRERCAVCELHIRALLDAAHVVEDRSPKGEIIVNEGIALCATHHRAFDAHILDYDEEYVIRIQLPDKKAIGEGERNMLLAFDGKPLTLPKNRDLWPMRRAGW